jgi:ElaB/YqjD/DUF883 family membrane-anchored ribosome-binding protein
MSEQQGASQSRSPSGSGGSGASGGSSGSGGRSQSQSRSDDLQAEVESLKSDLQRLQGDLRQVSDKAWGVGRSTYNATSDAVHERVEHSMQQVQDAMQRQPITTVLVTFVSGVVFGKLFSRRR